MTSNEGVCPGACNKKYRRVHAAYLAELDAYDPLDSGQRHPDRPEIQPVYGRPVWCGDCTAKIRQRLADLDELAAMLGWVADGHKASSAAYERVSGSKEQLSQSDAADMLADLTGILREHEDAYREAVLGIGGPARRGFLAAASSQCIAWLGHHLDDILASDIGEGFGADVLDWYGRWVRDAKADQPHRTKPLRCPGCSMMLLVWQEGSDRLVCANDDCGRVLTYAEYEGLVGVAVAEIERGGQAPTAA
jgi:hypothetical protein